MGLSNKYFFKSSLPPLEQTVAPQPARVRIMRKYALGDDYFKDRRSIDYTYTELSTVKNSRVYDIKLATAKPRES